VNTLFLGRCYSLLYQEQLGNGDFVDFELIRSDYDMTTVYLHNYDDEMWLVYSLFPFSFATDRFKLQGNGRGSADMWISQVGLVSIDPLNQSIKLITWCSSIY
jgi:hypothetical protein